jgi:SAM-dependent methyltransferase
MKSKKGYLMRLQRDNIASVSDRRWRTAQKTEWESFRSHRRQDKGLPPEIKFYSQDFVLGSEFFNGKSILEVGCGFASEIDSLREARFRVGIDPLAGKWRHYYRNGTNHIRGRGEQLPFKDETFDVVLCFNVLNHVQSPIASLKEIQRCLKKGGTLLLWVHVFSAPKIIRSGLRLIDIPHPYHFSDSEVSLMLQELGYNVRYHQSRKASLSPPISLIKRGLFISGLRSLGVHLFLGLHESSYICLRTV